MTVLRPPEVAALLGVTVVQVQRWLVRGELPGAKVGGTWFIREDELLARLSSEGGQADAGRGIGLPGATEAAGRARPRPLGRAAQPRATKARARLLLDEILSEHQGRGSTDDAWRVPPTVAR